MSRSTRTTRSSLLSLSSSSTTSVSSSNGSSVTSASLASKSMSSKQRPTVASKSTTSKKRTTVASSSSSLIQKTKSSSTTTSSSSSDSEEEISANNNNNKQGTKTIVQEYNDDNEDDNTDDHDDENDDDDEKNDNEHHRTNNNHKKSKTAHVVELPNKNSQIIQASYLEQSTNTRDLLFRLQNVVQVLRHDESIEADNTMEWSGLKLLAHHLLHKYVEHDDKNVRLQAILACMEMFHIYAPDVPWDRDDLVTIFQQTVRQLDNLSHTTDPNKQSNFRHYAHILELFAQVKIGCVIVDLAQQDYNNHTGNSGGIDNTYKKLMKGNDSISEYTSNDDTDSSGKILQQSISKQRKQNSSSSVSKVISSSSSTVTPLEVVVDLIHTLLHCVRNEHPVEILELVQQAIAACLDEYNPDTGTPFPICILDELLQCIGQGPTILVSNAAAHQQLSIQQKLVRQPQGGKQLSVVNGKRNHVKTGTDNTMKEQSTNVVQSKLPLHVERPNPTYLTATAVIRLMLNKLASPIAQLLNGLLNGESHILEQSCIRCPTSNELIENNDEDVRNDNNSGGIGDVYSIVYELHRVAPQILTTVIGTVSNGLSVPDTAKRAAVTNLLGRLFSAVPSHIHNNNINNSTNMMSSTGSKNHQNLLASKFRPCYREWLRRSVDIESSIRVTMVKHCVAILRQSGMMDATICQEASDTVVKLLTSDPHVDVRLEAIHQVTDLVYKFKTICNQNTTNTSSGDESAGQTQNNFHSINYSMISPAILRAVGSRCSSKHKQERQDAVTALAKIYYQQYMMKQLKPVLAGGDDCHVGIIQDILHRTCTMQYDGKKRKSKGGTTSSSHLDEENEARYSWIPSKVFECLCYTDQVDSEMRNRVVQIIDEVLLGGSSNSSSHSSKTSSQGGSLNGMKLTPTARAVGLVIIFDAIRNPNHSGGQSSKTITTTNSSEKENSSSSTNAFKFMQQFFTRRSKLQQIISNYIDARATIRECQAGTEEEMAAEAKAMELLEMASTFLSPIQGSSPLEDVLTTFHGARDKHIFRILAVITNPAHTMQARIRALDELPKRTKSLGNGVSEWIKDLVKKCAMSEFLNAEVIHHCVLLSQECFNDDDIATTALILSCVKSSVEIFPSLAAGNETFTTLTELFSDCRMDKKNKKEVESYRVTTILSSILSLATTTKPSITDNSKSNVNADELQAHLLRLCVHDGTPEQARNAVYAFSRMLRNGTFTDESNVLSAKSTQSSTEDQGTDSPEAFSHLLQALTSSVRLKVETGDKEATNSRILSTLSALSALSDCAPTFMASSNRGCKALRFALEQILEGKESAPTVNDADDDSVNSINSEQQEEDQNDRSNKKRRVSSSSPERSSKAVFSPKLRENLVEDSSLSINCRRICAALDFLVSHIRATILEKTRASKSSIATTLLFPTESDTQKIFQLFCQILRDKGCPPSNRDRRHCKARQERAALRQCAAIQILRLSDARLGLEKKMLSPSMMLCFSEVFLDDEFSVRAAAMEELASFLTGSGIYGMEGSKLPPKTPSLRFLALVSLCTDGEHGSENSMVNGGAANVGKLSTLTKNAAFQCIVNLRKVTEASIAHCRAVGKEAEKKFESHFKMLLMPEYSVPYMFHLLSHRRETPSAGGITAATDDVIALQNTTSNDDEDNVLLNDEGQQRVLRKRLKQLFEPLIQSLGEEADNISFLLRMTEILGKHYKPIDTSSNAIQTSAWKSKRFSIDSVSSGSHGDDVSIQVKDRSDMEDKRCKILQAKLKTICSAAREVLLTFVKKDVNLRTYPGIVQLPSTLFVRTDLGSVRVHHDTMDQVEKKATKRKSRKTTTKITKDNSPIFSTTPTRKYSTSKSNSSGRKIKEQDKTPETLGNKKSKSSLSPKPFGSVLKNSHSKSNTTEESIIEHENSTSKIESIEGSSRKNRVHFSPEVNNNNTRSDVHDEISDESTTHDNIFGNLSPIAKSISPPFRQLAQKEKSSNSNSIHNHSESSDSPATNGTTPPSALRSYTQKSRSVVVHTTDGDKVLTPDLSTESVQSPLLESNPNHSKKNTRSSRSSNRTSSSVSEVSDSRSSQLSSDSFSTVSSRPKRSASIMRDEVRNNTTSSKTRKVLSSTTPGNTVPPNQIKLNRSTKSSTTTTSSTSMNRVLQNVQKSGGGGQTKLIEPKRKSTDDLDFDYDDEDPNDTKVDMMKENQKRNHSSSISSKGGKRSSRFEEERKDLIQKKKDVVVQVGKGEKISKEKILTTTTTRAPSTRLRVRNVQK